MVALPSATAVTSPELDTEATPELLDDHVAVLLTFCVVPPERFAVAVNWLVSFRVVNVPLPETTSPVTVADGFEAFLTHAPASTTTTMANVTSGRFMTEPPDVIIGPGKL